MKNKTNKPRESTDNTDNLIESFLGAPLPKEAGANHKSGYIAVVGQPNVGKSTLVNALLGHKIAIVSSKPQTTRKRILGIHTEPDTQILFVDTPGIHQPKSALNKFMMREVDEALHDCDAMLFVVDVSQPLRDADRDIAARIGKAGRPLMLAMNKADVLDPRDVVANVEAYTALVASSVRGCSFAQRSFRILTFSSSFSVAASITRSQVENFAVSVLVVIRASAA